MHEIQRKTVPGYLVKTEKAGDGVLEAIVSVFGNVDSYGERCILGCFEESIAKKLPKGVWSHNWDQPIAKTLECRELAPGDPLLPAEIQENGGLYVRAQFHEEITDSWQAYLKIKNEYVDEYSFGFRVVKREKDEETGIVDLLKLNIFEWSPVLVGANRATATLSVKQMLEDPELKYGLDLDEHTDLLISRWEQRLKARDADGSLNAAFVNRLKDAQARFAGLAPDSSTDRDSGEEAPTKGRALEMERSRHAAQLRRIRSGARN